MSAAFTTEEQTQTLVLTSPATVRISGLIPQSIVDGPGLRLVVFAQGCPHACPGCQNPGTHDFGGGYDCGIDDIIDRFDRNPLLSGITLSGGEPFSRAGELLPLAEAVRSRGKSVWCYSGYTFEEIRKLAVKSDVVDELCGLIDVLVDGRFELRNRSLDLLFRGSSNQRLVAVQPSLLCGRVVLYEPERF